MEGLTTEQEQIEEMRRWWQRNGKSVIAGLVVGLLAFAGISYWTKQQDTQRAAASALYEQVMDALDSGDTQVVADKGGTIISQYGSTPYAELAALALAKVKLQEQDLSSAKTYLQWAIDHGKQPGINHVARLRLARVLLAEGQAQQALALLNGAQADTFLAEYEELRGDAYQALGQQDNARSAYQRALDAHEMGDDTRYLEMKLDSLGGADGGERAAG